MLYYKHKLVRFTGVPLMLVECGDLQNKQRIKTKQCAPRVGAHQPKRPIHRSLLTDKIYKRKNRPIWPGFSIGRADSSALGLGFFNQATCFPYKEILVHIFQNFAVDSITHPLEYVSFHNENFLTRHTETFSYCFSAKTGPID